MAGMYEKDAPIKVQEVGTVIYNVDSSKTPLTRLIKTAARPNQELSEWEAEAYPNDSYGGTLDGTDRGGASDFSKTEREKIEAYAQLQQSPGWLVSTKMAATLTPATKRNEKGHQKLRDAERFALQIEKCFASDQDTCTESGGVPSRSRGAFSWLQATAQSNKPVPASFRPDSAAVWTAALSGLTAKAFEAMVAAASEQIRQAVNWTMPCGSVLKARMSEWLQKNTDVTAATEQVTLQYSLNGADKTLMRVCNRFEFECGIVTNMLHYNLLTDSTGAATAYSSRSALLMDFSMWDVGYLINPTHREFPDMGGGERGDHIAEFILRMRNGRGQGMIKTNS